MKNEKKIEENKQTTTAANELEQLRALDRKIRTDLKAGANAFEESA